MLKTRNGQQKISHCGIGIVESCTSLLLPTESNYQFSVEFMALYMVYGNEMFVGYLFEVYISLVNFEQISVGWR
jgi:hypothetical protein